MLQTVTNEERRTEWIRVVENWKKFKDFKVELRIVRKLLKKRLKILEREICVQMLKMLKLS